MINCKDCKYYNAETKGCKRNPSVEAWEENDYCSYGERGRMKNIKPGKSLQIVQTSNDGGCGLIKLPRDNRKGYTAATVVWSWGTNWEHVSVAPLNGTMPKWEDMCFVKDMFWNDDEWVVQYHPPKSEYVNNVPNCLHLWKPIKDNLPTPPSVLVGIKGIEFKRMKR